MKKECITHLNAENGVVSRATSKEKSPMTNEQLTITLRFITRIVIIILTGIVIITAEPLKLGILAVFALFAVLFRD